VGGTFRWKNGRTNLDQELYFVKLFLSKVKEVEEAIEENVRICGHVAVAIFILFLDRICI
jgi:hypothetical protein